MSNVLRVLDDVSYLLECLALDYTGEFKTEIDRLCKRLDSDDPDYAIYDREKIEVELRTALFLLKNGDKESCSAKLSNVSRSLWKQAWRENERLRSPVKKNDGWFSEIKNLLLIGVGYFIFAPAFVVIVLRGFIESSLSVFIDDFLVLCAVCIGMSFVFATAGYLDYRRKLNRDQ
ncbi:MAG: hypothetical protein KF800_06655 [Lysobacter sp.]|nr:hypothetical protein [Lysobacter sp.]